MSATVVGVSVENRSGQKDIGLSREYSVTYKITTDNDQDGPQVVFAVSGLPTIGSAYSVGNDVDSQCYCSGLSANQVGPKVWEVVATYDNAEVTIGGVSPLEVDDFDNPLDYPPEVMLSNNTIREVLPPQGTEGNDAIGVVASNGELFNPQPEWDVSRPVVTITENVSAISLSGLADWANSVNNDTYMGNPPRTLRMNSPQAVRRYSNDIGKYWTVTYTMEFCRKKWDITALNQGTYYLTTDGKTAAKVTDPDPSSTGETGEGFQVIVNLTEDGGLVTDIATSNLSYSTWRMYKEKDFASLGFSSTLFS